MFEIKNLTKYYHDKKQLVKAVDGIVIDLTKRIAEVNWYPNFLDFGTTDR
jgi:hypothetical protein